MARYKYRIVAGAGIFSPLLSLRECKSRIAQVQQAFPTYAMEIERVLEIGDGRRYWQWRDGRWVLWSKTGDPSANDLLHWRSA